MCAEDIFGTNFCSLQGKATCRKIRQVTTLTEDLPTGMLEQHRNVTIEVDIMYINKIPFVLTVSRGIHFGTAELMKNEKRQLLPHQ